MMALSKTVFKEEGRTKKLKLFNKYFVGEMETKLRGFNSELKGQVLKQGKSVEIGSFAGETVGTVLGTTLGLLTGGQMIDGSAKIGEWVVGKLSGFAAKKLAEKSRRKKLSALANDVEDFGEKQNTDESRKEWRQFIVSISHTIFQSYEMQMMTAESCVIEKYHADALHSLARDAVDRIIDYAVNSGHLCVEGLIYGKSKTTEFIAMPEWYKPDLRPKGFEIKYNGKNCRTTDLYEKVGWAIWKSAKSSKYYCVCKSFNGIKISEPEKFGFRCTFQDEDLTNLIKISKRISASDYSKFTNYEYWNNYKKDAMLEILMTDLENGDTTFLEKRFEEIAKEVREYVKLVSNDVNEGLASLGRIEKSTIQTHEKLDNLADTFKETLVMVKVLSEINGGVSTLNENIYFDKKDPVALFTGRKHELVDLHNLIQRSIKENELDAKPIALPEKTTIITGLGGIGKTQLALRYAQLYNDKYNNNTLWINAETESSISNSFRRLASETLNIKLKTVEGQEKTIASVVAEVYTFFSKTKALFIFDNADGPFNKVFFPTGEHKPFILITSRMQKWGQFAVFRLDTFTDSDAIQFVKKGLNIINEAEEESTKNLVKLLQNFPLALQQAVSFINETNAESKIFQAEYKITDYLNNYKEKNKAQYLLDHKFYDEIGIQSSTTTYTTWIVTVDKIKQNKNHGQLSTKIFNIMSYFASNKISPQIFLPLTEGNENKLASAVKLLIKYSMVNQVDGLLNVHPLVQEITLSDLSTDKQRMEEYLQNAQNLLIKYFNLIDNFSERQQFVLPHIESLLSTIKHWVKSNPMEKKTIEQENVFNLLQCLADGYKYFDCRKTISLLKELLTKKEEHFGKEHFQVAATLQELSNAHDHLGDPKTQKDLLERALMIKEKHYGPEHYQVATTLQDLGNAHGTLGDPKMNKDLLERAFAINEKHYGPEHYQVAATLRDLGNAHGALGDPKMKKDLLVRALVIKEKRYGPEHYLVAATLQDLGNAYGHLGDQKMKKDLLVKALAIEEKHYGPEHYLIAATLRDLGNAHGALGDPKMNKDLLERALAIEEKHYGPEHYLVAATLQDLGNAHGALGDPKMQKDLLVRALAIKEKHYGPEHYLVAATLQDLGNAYDHLGDPKMKKNLLERALAIEEKHYGPEHYLVAATLRDLGNAHGALGDPEMNKDLLERALPIQEKHYGPEHYLVAATLRDLGNAHGALDDPKMNKDLLERALMIKEKHYGPEHYLIAATLQDLGNVHGALGDPKMNKDLLERALAIQEKHYGSEHYLVAATLQDLGNVHGTLGDPKMNKDFLERALAIQEKHYGPEHYQVAITLNDLGLTYGALGDKEMQNALIKRAIPLIQSHYGQEHKFTAIVRNNLNSS